MTKYSWDRTTKKTAAAGLKPIPVDDELSREPKPAPVTTRTGRKLPLRLTKRELTMIQGIVDAKNNKRIASDCGLKNNTVKVYLSHLYEKLGVGDRFGLGNWGRAYTESQRLIAVRYRELQRELNPEGPEIPDQPPVLANASIAEFDVFKAMAQTITLTPDQCIEILYMLSPE